MRKATKKKIAPVVITVAVVVYVVPLVLMVLAAAVGLGADGLAVAPFLLSYLLLGGAVVVGIIKALLQRLREIDGGEEEASSQY